MCVAYNDVQDWDNKLMILWKKGEGLGDDSTESDSMWDKYRLIG